MTTENAGEGASKVMSWGMIVGIMLATGLVVGFTLGALGEVLGVQTPSAGIGASVGVVGALLIGRRRAALAAQAKAGGG